MVGGEHAVHMGEAGFDAADHLVLSCHAAAEENFLLRVAALGVGQGAQVAEDRCSACSRMAQVFITTTSAPSASSTMA